MATPVSGADTWLTINGKALLFSSNDENACLNIGEYSHNTLKITANAPATIAIVIADIQLETEHYGIWNWNPAHYAGLYHFVIEAPTYLPQHTWVRVFPHKFSQPLYEQMKTDLSTLALDLLFRLDSPATERARYSAPFQETSALHDYKQIRLIIEDMRDVFLHIQQEPYTLLDIHTIQQDVQKIPRFSKHVTPLPGQYVRLPEILSQHNDARYLPARWKAERKQPSYDTYENRLLKQFLLRQLLPKLHRIQEHAEREKKKTEETYARYHNMEDKDKIQKLHVAITECHQMKQRCSSWSGERFLQTVQPFVLTNKATQVLLKHPSYSRFYHLYLQFQQRLQITFETEQYVIALALRRVSELYEMWSIFCATHSIITELLAAGYHMISNTTFYEVNKDYFQFDVHKNVASIILIKEDMRVEIKYEPVYPNQSSVNQCSALVCTTMGSNPLTPDMAVEVYKNGEPQDILIFDAKYRRERAPDGQFYPKTEDIDKMYRYYHNIQYRHYQPDQGRQLYTMHDIVSSAYIFYPANKIYTENNKHIGALPFIPNMSPQRLKDVYAQLKDLLYNAYLID